MTFKQAKKLEWSGVRVVIDAGTEHAEHARLWCADAKWTADMKGMATVQRVNEDGTTPSWAPRDGNLIVERRRLKLLSDVISTPSRRR